MATQLTIVNDVLRRLREDTVSSVASTDYSQFIGQLVNDAKEELEDMWFWTVNETAIDTTILADGTLTYDLTGTTDRSFLIRQVEDRLPMAFDVTSNEERQLYDISLKERNIIRDTWRGVPDDSAAPQYFSIQPDSDGRGYTLSLPYGSTTARTWRTYWYAPQAALALDGTDNNTEVLLPRRPIYTKALLLASLERGEEIGTPIARLDRQAMDATAAALELDMQVHKKSAEIDLTNLEALRTAIIGD